MIDIFESGNLSLEGFSLAFGEIQIQIEGFEYNSCHYISREVATNLRDWLTEQLERKTSDG